MTLLQTQNKIFVYSQQCKPSSLAASRNMANDDDDDDCKLRLFLISGLSKILIDTCNRRKFCRQLRYYMLIL